MKWNWEHAMQMGLDVEEIWDEETGELLDYQGDFIYADRETLHTIEDVAAFILDLLDEQKKGNLPFDLLISYGIQLDLSLVKCLLKRRKTTTNGMRVQCQLNLVM